MEVVYVENVDRKTVTTIEECKNTQMYKLW